MIRGFFRRPPAEPDLQIAPGHRIYAVGDVHGRANLLDDLLNRIEKDARTCADGHEVTYVFLGDYIDRGDDSKNVLARLMDLRDAQVANTVFLLGNHEAFLLAFLDDPQSGARWLDFGGDRTLRSYGVAPPQRNADAKILQYTRDALHDALGGHLQFITGLDRLWQCGDFAFVHAAINPRLPLDAQHDKDLLWGNQAFLRGRRGRAGVRVVHGHYDSAEPVVRPDRICIDTGAYYSGVLTAVCIDTDVRFIQTEV